MEAEELDRGIFGTINAALKNGPPGLSIKTGFGITITSCTIWQCLWNNKVERILTQVEMATKGKTHQTRNTLDLDAEVKTKTLSHSHREQKTNQMSWPQPYRNWTAHTQGRDNQQHRSLNSFSSRKLASKNELGHTGTQIVESDEETAITKNLREKDSRWDRRSGY